ncbi:MAG: hypothetical protein AAB553_03650 [Patescibacteria group bacterium]
MVEDGSTLPNPDNPPSLASLTSTNLRAIAERSGGTYVEIPRRRDATADKRLAPHAIGVVKYPGNSYFEVEGSSIDPKIKAGSIKVSDGEGTFLAGMRQPHTVEDAVVYDDGESESVHVVFPSRGPTEYQPEATRVTFSREGATTQREPLALHPVFQRH